MTQVTLFDIESIPQTETVTPKKPATRYYLRRKQGGSWQFLWKTHTNGGCEWCLEYELTINGGRKKPLLYKTLSGASRMLGEYIGFGVGSVAVWDGK